MPMQRILLTGGAGFIGSNFIRLMLRERPEVRIVNLDLLTYAGNPQSLEEIEADHGPAGDGRHRFVHGDIADGELVARLLEEERPETVINFAAESHVDRSILDAGAFIRTNVLGVQTLLDAIRARGDTAPRLVQISTDEVYGSLGPEGAFCETTPLAPNSPYSASKASGDLLIRAAAQTHGMDAVITRCSNNYGPWQFPEKLIPLMILRALADESLPVYGDGMNVRDWIHVEDHCRAIALVAERGVCGEVYNIGGLCEKPNIEIVRGILDALDKPHSLIRFVTDRPGHDRRYAMDIAKIERELGWRPRIEFSAGLSRTIDWYRDNPAWCRAVRDGEYRRYIQTWYDKR